MRFRLYEWSRQWAALPRPLAPRNPIATSQLTYPVEVCSVDAFNYGQCMLDPPDDRWRPAGGGACGNVEPSHCILNT